jgi:hypothetical protein
MSTRSSAAALLVFVPLLLGLLYLFTRTTPPYEAAERFLRSDTRIASAVGPVVRVSFKFWAGFHFTGEEASFVFEVTGTSGACVVALQLQRSGGKWLVFAADLRGSDGSTKRIVGAVLRGAASTFARVRFDAWISAVQPAIHRVRGSARGGATDSNLMC